MSCVIWTRNVRHHIIASDLGPTNSSFHPVTRGAPYLDCYTRIAFDTLALFLDGYPLLRGVSARSCPMSYHFLTRWVSMLLGWRWYPGHSPVLVPNAFPFASYISMFSHSLFFTCHWISFVFLLYDWCVCTYLPTHHALIHFLDEFPGLGLQQYNIIFV